MSRRNYDPLDCIPSADVVRAKLEETLSLAQRLRILLDLAERLRLPLAKGSDLVTTADRPEVARG